MRFADGHCIIFTSRDLLVAVRTSTERLVMPVVACQVGSISDPKAYVTGSPLSKRDIRAVRRNHPHVKAWSHDSLLPRKIHWLWIVPLHVVFLAATYLAFDLPLTDLRLAIVMFAVASGACVVQFWDHILMNRRTRILLHTRLMTYDVQNRNHRGSWAEEWHSTALRYITSYFLWRTLKPFEYGPDGFSKWLKEQLYESAPYFSRVHPIVDAHMYAIQYAQLQLKNGISDRVVSEKLDEAGDVAFGLLKPIFEESEVLRLREEKEMNERKVHETEYLESEEKSLTVQRIAIACDDLDVYIEGHKALAAES